MLVYRGLANVKIVMANEANSSHSSLTILINKSQFWLSSPIDEDTLDEDTLVFINLGPRSAHKKKTLL